MKIFILADPNSPHTIKWVNSLIERGNEIFLFGLNRYDSSIYHSSERLQIFADKLTISTDSGKDGSLKKIIYLKLLIKLKRKIKDFAPDILHAHYASSYGLLGALTNFHPFIVSVWGSDIFNFPNKSYIHKEIIRYVLKKADKVLSTSHIMARQTNLFTNKNIEVTPFGIDVQKFRKSGIKIIFKDKDIVIGTIKSLEKKYGIEYLIKAFKEVKTKFPELSLKLLIVGRGSLKPQLEQLAKELNLNNDIIFTGFILPDEIPNYHNLIDVFVSLSAEDSESFGVAVLEASACEKPVIVSDAGGLPEVVEDKVTGFIVRRKNIEEAAFYLTKLIEDKDLRERMGKAGRERVIKMYNWSSNVEQMISIYESLIS